MVICHSIGAPHLPHCLLLAWGCCWLIDSLQIFQCEGRVLFARSKFHHPAWLTVSYRADLPHGALRTAAYPAHLAHTSCASHSNLYCSTTSPNFTPRRLPRCCRINAIAFST